ncbi:probable malonyl-CoA-acyl carrier protein transacylase, mitochondrial [Anoplophora glabripennis]|uniref:probable malonyl-CoA-acyl carrier protein transacylase, mitochondrial n=1 Tax=Anoplophora glabripennis TaxID=217634 RepID=UPI00087426AE|nr:probable malonyl-CoA-acyl carrier protein transacylase, mitochondrial [Anoplophora glabripennis]
MIFQFSYKLCKEYGPIKYTITDKVRSIIRHFYVLATLYERNKCNITPLKKALDDSLSLQDIYTKYPNQQWVTLPFAGKATLRKQGDFFKNSKHVAQESSILLFPGQGSQYPGMANNLIKFPMAKDLFELSNYVLGYDLLQLCTEGPKEMLDQTKYCQPAVMVCSLAAIEKLKEERPNAIANCVATAGFSLGEITALIFAGALCFEEGKTTFKKKYAGWF